MRSGMLSAIRSFALTAAMSLAFAASAGAASGLSLADAQQILTAAQSAAASGDGARVEVTIDGKPVAFIVTCNAAGTITARPVVTPGTGDVTISQVQLAIERNSNGTVTVKSFTVYQSNGSSQAFDVTSNRDGSL